ncbi:hypothetical protein Q3G72_025398 [Acer saccharum]|nr:hypothetical protein Q3G72_025398 [Acer saccharum]
MVVDGIANLFDRQSIMEMMIDERPTVFAHLELLNNFPVVDYLQWWSVTSKVKKLSIAMQQLIASQSFKESTIQEKKTTMTMNKEKMNNKKKKAKSSLRVSSPVPGSTPLYATSFEDYTPRIDRSQGTFALVLVPTHELCMRVYEILQKLLHRFHWIVPGYVMGGESQSKEKARVGRTARLGQRGDSLLFLQPIEVDYLQDLEKDGVSLAEYPLMKKALESFILAEMKNLAKDAFCSWVRAYTAHRGELKGIFMVKKLHLGHVAKSFALKEQPSLVGRSFQMQTKKRKRDQKQKQKGPMRKRKVASKT